MKITEFLQSTCSSIESHIISARIPETNTLGVARIEVSIKSLRLIDKDGSTYSDEIAASGPSPEMAVSYLCSKLVRLGREGMRVQHKNLSVPPVIPNTLENDYSFEDVLYGSRGLK